MQLKKTHALGVSLIELMIVVAIVGILAAIAYPSYQSQIRKSHRADAKTELLEIQIAQEKWFLQNNAYATSLSTLGFGSSSRHGYYSLSLSATGTTFTATAAPEGGQEDDSCGTYSITHTGTKSPTTSGCW